MVEKKKQHFVPRFYLKQFSNRGEGTHIGLFQKNENNHIREAGLAGQAYENYFYGKDGTLEDKLSEIEALSSQVILEVATTLQLPKRDSQPYMLLWLYTILQSSRTKFAVKEIETMINLNMHGILKLDERFKDKIEGLQFGIDEPAAFSVLNTLQGCHIAYDLHCKLLVNRTSTPFIISDHPVAKYNQFLEMKNKIGGWTGLASKGLQIYFPITPNLMLIFYDARVYKVGTRKRLSVEITTNSDINALNALQMINADKLIFFNEKIKSEYVKTLFDQTRKHDLNDIVEIKQIERELPNGEHSILFHTSLRNIELKLRLSFIKYTDHAKKYELTNWAVELRDEKLRYQNYDSIIR